jgi:hypothetical protein
MRHFAYTTETTKWTAEINSGVFTRKYPAPMGLSCVFGFVYRHYVMTS